jgi:hypothetical protein
MSEDTKTNTIKGTSADVQPEEVAPELQTMETAESEPISMKDESVQMRAARKIMREYADTLKMLADS